MPALKDQLLNIKKWLAFQMLSTDSFYWMKAQLEELCIAMSWKIQAGQILDLAAWDKLGKLEHISLWVKHRQMEKFGAAEQLCESSDVPGMVIGPREFCKQLQNDLVISRGPDAGFVWKYKLFAEQQSKCLIDSGEFCSGKITG